MTAQGRTKQPRDYPSLQHSANASDMTGPPGCMRSDHGRRGIGRLRRGAVARTALLSLRIRQRCLLDRVHWRSANSLVCSYSRPRRALVPTIAQAFPRTFLLIATARSVRRCRRRFLITTRSNRRRRRYRNGRWARRRDGRTIFMHVSFSLAVVVGCCCRLLSSLPSAALLLPAASVGSRRLQLRRPCCRGGEIERPALSGVLVYNPSRRAEIAGIKPYQQQIRARARRRRIRSKHVLKNGNDEKFFSGRPYDTVPISKAFVAAEYYGGLRCAKSVLFFGDCAAIFCPR